MSIRITLSALAAGALLVVAGARASSPPVGPLPAGPTQHITAPRGQLVALALPAAASGRVWRVARPYDARVLRQVSEANVGANVVVVYRTVKRGTTTVTYGLTRGETRHAYAARRFRVTVR
jgi:hypothetical protein